MHKKLPKIYYFINNFDKNLINNLNLNIALIYRNYNKKINLNLLNDFKEFCKIKKRKFFLSNNIKLALKLNLDGAYIPSFNNDVKHCNYSTKSDFILLGSAHNLKELRIKESQCVDVIFLASLFNRKRTYLGFNKFRNLSKFTKLKVIALGGVEKNNLKRIKLLNVYGFAGISFFNKKKSPWNKFKGFLILYSNLYN